MPFAAIPFLLLAVPIMEIAAFIVIGGQIGVLPTLGLIVVTAIIGSILLRVQGLGLLARIQEETRAGRVPGRELIHGVMILVAGVLLLTPGFVTDTLGFLLFVPAIRDAGWRLLRERIVVVAQSAGPGRRHGGDAGGGDARGGDMRGDTVVDLDEAEFQRDPSPDSPWAPDGKNESAKTEGDDDRRSKTG